MDLPYSQQQQARRKNRSAANLQHLTLAPLTTRLPLRDDYDGSGIIDSHAYFSTAAAHAGRESHSSEPTARIPSYILGRSAPATPRLLSKSPTASRSHSHEGGRRAPSVPGSGSRTPGGAGASNGNGNGAKNHAGGLAKSLSTTHLGRSLGGSSGGSARQHRRRKTDNNGNGGEDGDGDGGDWLFRTAVLVTAEARESKGQSWLTARASSTSLTGLRSAEEAEDAAAFERELAREREHLDRIAGGGSRRGSRRGSLDHDAASSPVGGPRAAGSRMGSRAGSRLGSRATSRAGSRIQLFTPMDARRSSLEHNGMGVPGEAGYFDYGSLAGNEDEYREAGLGGPTGLMTPAGPDFINLDEKLEAVEFSQRDTSLEDEDHIRRLVKREKAGGIMGSWLGSVFGWSLFSVQETEGEGDETDEDGEDDEEEDEEDSEDSEDDEDDEDGEDGETEEAESAVGKDGKSETPGADGRRRRSRKRRVAVGWNRRGPAWATGRRRFEGDDGSAAEAQVPPPPAADEGTWQDAAWLLSVASKVIL